MNQSIRPTKTGYVALTTILGLIVMSTGCSGEEPSDDDAPTSTSTATPTSTNATDPSATSASTGATGPSATSASTSGTGNSSSVDTSSGSANDDTSTSTTTGGAGLCEIMLPPPGMCPALGQGSGRVVWLPYDRSQPGVEQLAVPADPHGGGFIMEPDGGGGLECDVFAQDCPAGEKCMPWANDGGSAWNSTRCSPIAPMPDQIGDTCTVEGSGVSGVDSCDLAQMCWDVDSGTNEGTCVEMCSCTLETPVCETPNTICAISNDGVLALCLGVCNPLDPTSCEAGEGCYPSGDYFQCAPDASGGSGAPGDPCEFINVCQPGTVCVSPSLVPGCAGTDGCCTALCDPDEGAGPCIAGQDCIPWYEPGAAPDECLGQVGACIVP